MRRRNPRHRLSAAAVTILMTAGTLVLAASPAAAHETRQVGDVIMVVGFGEEPAYAGMPNSVQARLSTATEAPILELEELLNVEVRFGDAAMSLEMEPNFVPDVFGEPGDYRADFVPTRAGQYTFHFTGTVNGTEIDEEFTSGPETFSDVTDPSALAFPAADPSPAQLAERLEREGSRVQAARTMALAGVGLSAVALVVALVSVGLALRRRGA